METRVEVGNFKEVVSTMVGFVVMAAKDWLLCLEDGAEESCLFPECCLVVRMMRSVSYAV